MVVSSLNSLIRQLKQLQIEQQENLQQQHRIIQQISDNLSTIPPPSGERVNPSTHDSDPIVWSSEHTAEKFVHTPLRRAEGIRATTTISDESIHPVSTPHDKQHQTDTFKIGDHIYIKNKITHSANTQPKDRAAVITNISGHKVSLRTYTGAETWRSPYNIRKLSTAEQSLYITQTQDE